MKFKGIFILLIALTWSFSSSAQAKLPITGTFKVQEDGKTLHDYDKIVITEKGYSLLKGEKTLSTYKVISKNSEGYLVEQFFEGNAKKDKPRFTVSLDKEEKSVYYITVFRGSRIEKLKLIKIK